MLTLKTRRWNWYLYLLISLVGSALLGASASTLAAPLAYTASVKPTSGPAGSAANVTASGFTPGFNAAVRWGGDKGPDLWTTKNSTATFVADITIPVDAKPGVYTLFVCNNCGGGEFEESALTQFEVIAAPATPIPPPTLKSFFADQTSLTVGECTTLHWEAFDATSVYLTTPNGQEGVGGVDSRQACPTQTFTYILTVNGYPGSQPPSQEGKVTLTVSQATATSQATPTKTTTPKATPTRTRTPRATATPTRLPVSPTAPIVLGDFDFDPLINPATDPGFLRPLGYCSSIDFGTGARVIDFEGQAVGTALVNQYSSQGVRFGPGTAIVGRPPMTTHSPSQAVHSPSDDFGSAFHPILLRFDSLMSAVGLFVGREGPAYSGESSTTATLTAFGPDSSGRLVSIAEDHIFLPAGPVPIERCLIVRAPEGQGIRAARLEYTDWEGISHTTRRWMDDLYLLRSSLTGRNTPPVVEITAPRAGETITTSGVSLLARITEDIGLGSSVYARVNGGDTQTLWISQNTSDLSRYSAGALLTGLTPFASNTVEIRAYDTHAEYGSDTVTFNYQPTSGVDLSLNRVEVTQAIQCLNNTLCADNSVPLYVGKPTLVRAYVFLDRGPTTLANISGRLCRGNTGATSCVSPLRPGRSINLNQANNSIGALRNDLTLTLNFLLPMDWVARAGSLDFTVYVNYNGENSAECCNDNNRQYLNLFVRTGRTVDVVFLPVRANGFQPPEGELWPIVDWLSRVYPVSRVQPWVNPDPVANTYNFSSTSGGGGTFGAFSGCGQGWGDLMSDLWWFNVWHGDPADWTRYYGMVDQRSLGGAPFIGCGMRPGSVSGGIVNTGDRNGAETAAQEIAHNHGRQHAPSGGAGGTDSSYPNPSGLLDEWGVDVGRMQLYPPTSSFDYMGYGGSEGDTWTSIYTYRAMASAIQSVAQAPSGSRLTQPAQPQIDPGEFFIGSGVISPDSLKVLSGFYRATLPVTTNDGLISGPYKVQMLDEAGQVLYQRGFSLPEVSNTPSEAGGGFYLILPWKEGTTNVAFQYNEVEIGRVTRTASVPQVKVTAPVGGEQWGADEEQPVSWAATDPDGDPLMYSVQYSPDKGQTWYTIGVNVTDTAIKINTAHLPGGEAGLVRVTASDGFNSAWAESPNTFTVEGHAPEVFIGSPDNGVTLIEGEPLVLHAYGTDVEDGPLAEGTFGWASSVDGSLGSGDLIIADALSVGAHDLTVTGKDAQGNTATYTVKVIVQPAPTAPAEPNSGTVPGVRGMPPMFILLGIGGVLIVGVGLIIVVAAIVLGLRRRA